LEGLAWLKPIFEEIRARMAERIPIWASATRCGRDRSSFQKGLIASYEPAEENGKDTA
jgi:hypothetical protein